MKVQRKISLGGSFAKIKEDINDGDIITIADEGKIVSGEFGDRHVFKIETKNGEKLLSFNQTSMNNLIEVYGEETNEWQGEKAKVWIIKSNVAGKMRNVIYLAHPDWVMNDEGFSPEGGVPVIEEE